MDKQHHLQWVQGYRSLVSSSAGKRLDADTIRQLSAGQALCDQILNENPNSPTIARLRNDIAKLLGSNSDNASEQIEPEKWLEEVCITKVKEAVTSASLHPLLHVKDTLTHEQDRADWQAAINILESSPPNWQNEWTVADIVNAINTCWCLPRNLLLILDEVPVKKGVTPVRNRENLWLSDIRMSRVVQSYEFDPNGLRIPVHVIEKTDTDPMCVYSVSQGCIQITEGFSHDLTNLYDQSAATNYPPNASPDCAHRKSLGQFLLNKYPDREDRRKENLNRILLEEFIHYIFAEQIKSNADYKTMTIRQFWCHALKAMTPSTSQLHAEIQARADIPTPQQENEYHDTNMAHFELAARIAVVAKIENPHYLVHEFGMFMHDNRSYPHYASARLAVMFAGLLFKLPQQLGLNHVDAEDANMLQQFQQILVNNYEADDVRKVFEFQSNTLFSPKILDHALIQGWQKSSVNELLDTA